MYVPFVSAIWVFRSFLERGAEPEQAFRVSPRDLAWSLAFILQSIKSVGPATKPSGYKRSMTSMPDGMLLKTCDFFSSLSPRRPFRRTVIHFAQKGSVRYVGRQAKSDKPEKQKLLKAL